MGGILLDVDSGPAVGGGGQSSCAPPILPTRQLCTHRRELLCVVGFDQGKGYKCAGGLTRSSSYYGGTSNHTGTHYFGGTCPFNPGPSGFRIHRDCARGCGDCDRDSNLDQHDDDLRRQLRSILCAGSFGPGTCNASGEPPSRCFTGTGIGTANTQQPE